MDSDSEFSSTPPEIADFAKNITLNLLPTKSRGKYEKQYNIFMDWCRSKKIKKYSENVLLTYFGEKSKTLKSSTLWSQYSMLRSTLQVKNDINISKYTKLIAFLKLEAVGYKAKKSQTFSKEQVESFIRFAPDDEHLLRKVILIMGIAGACRRDELIKIELKDIDDRESFLVVRIPDSKTNQSRTFAIINSAEENAIDYMLYYRKYFNLRQQCQINSNNIIQRLFLRYSKGKCFNQVIGMNTVGKVPSEIASFLKLPDKHLFTGHCFRRTSATLLVNGGGDLIQLKKHGGWKSSNVAEGYIAESISNKIDTFQKISGNAAVPTSEELSIPSISDIAEKDSEDITLPSTSSGPGINIKNCQNCTFNFNIVGNK